jgi:phytoene synthase
VKPLDATYQARAVPPGTPRYWSWLFAAAQARAPLLGIYALLAEWQALTDPATESGVAHLKLAWWREEMLRLAAGSAVHPISTYLAALPLAGGVDFKPLVLAVETAASQIGGAPLERSVDLETQSQNLWGAPLALASSFGASSTTGGAGDVKDCTQALAAALHLANALADYGRDSRFGRVPFAIDELLAAGIDNDDLGAVNPPPHLRAYLDTVRARAAGYFETAARALPGAQRPGHRHLLVLAALGLKQLRAGRPLAGGWGVRDMLLAWGTARRANAQLEFSR